MSPISEKLPSTLSTPPETPVSTAHDGLAELRTKIEKYRATLAPEKRSGADTLLASLEKTTLDGVQVTKNGIETSIDAKNRFLGTLTVDQKNLMGTIERGAAGISEKTKASIGEVRDIVSAVAGWDTTALGDIAKKAGVDGAKIDQAAKAAKEAASGVDIGAAFWGMFAGIVAFIQKILDWIGGFFPGLTKAVEGIIPSVQAKPTPAWQTPSATPTVSPKETGEKMVKDLKMKVMKDLKENWNVNFEDPQTAKKFEKVWLSYRDGMQTNAEKIGSIAQWGRGNILTETANLGLSQVGFLADLVGEELIPMEAIKTQVVDGMILFSIKSLKSLGQMGESQMGQVLAKMSLEDPKIESLTAPQRTLMNQIFIHQNIVGLYLLSEIGGIMAAGTSMAFGWQSGTGIDAMKQTWATLRGQVPEALKKARNIAIAVGDEKILSHLTDTLTPGSQHSAWQLFEEFEIKTLVGHAAKSAKTQGALIEALTVLKGQYTSKITTQIIGEALSGATKASGLADAATALENTIRSAHVGSPRGWFQNMGDRVKGSLSRDAKYMGTHFDDANHVLRQQMNLVADGVKYRESMFGTGWTKLRTALQMKEGQFAAAIQKGTIPLHLKDADNFIPAMQQLSHESPDLVRAFFRNFALGIVVGTTATAGEWEKIKTLLQWLGGLVPIFGALYFIKEGFEFEWLKPVQMGLIGMGGAQLALEWVQLARIMQSPHRLREFGLFMARPAIMAKELVTGTFQVASLSRMAIQTYGKNPTLMAQSIRTHGGRISWGVLAAVSIWLVVKWVFDQISEQDNDAQIAKVFEKEWLGNPDGSLNTQKIKTYFAWLAESERQKVEDYLMRLHIGEGTRYGKGKDSDTIYVSSAAPTWQITALREDLAVLGREVKVELGRDGVIAWYDKFMVEAGGRKDVVRAQLQETLGISLDSLKKTVPQLFA